MGRKIILSKIISMRQDVQDVQYGLVELRDMYKEQRRILKSITRGEISPGYYHLSYNKGVIV